MIGYYLRLAFRGSSIYRWNNFPRIENISETDNLGMVLHTSFLLSKIVEEKEGKQVDLSYIFKKLLFSGFATFILSDINSDLKRRIQKRNPSLYDRLEEKVYNMLLSWDIPERIKEDIKLVQHADKGLFGDQYEIENEILSFSKLLIARQEAYHNSIVYKKSYKQVVESLEERINQEKYQKFNQYISDSVYSYLNTIRGLQFLFRWNRMKRNYPVSVMSHLFLVFFISYILGVLEDKNEEDLLQLMKIGIFHDIPEAITGDVVTPTKKAIEGFDKLLEDIEEEMTSEYITSHLEGYDFKEEINQLMLKPFSGDLGSLGKTADNLSAMFEAKVETPGNEEFHRVYKNTKKKLLSKEKYSVDYLLKFGVEYFDTDLEDIIVFN